MHQGWLEALAQDQADLWDWALSRWRSESEFVAEKVELFAPTSSFTIERLDAPDIVLGQDEGVGVAVGVDGEHECTRIAGVGQAQGVSKLMGSHQEQDVACTSKDRVRRAAQRHTHASVQVRTLTFI